MGRVFSGPPRPSVTGVLIMTWTDPSNSVNRLRSELWRRAPGSSRVQPQIIHTTLMRILSPAQLEEGVRKDIQGVCERQEEARPSACPLSLASAEEPGICCAGLPRS